MWPFKPMVCSSKNLSCVVRLAVVSNIVMWSTGAVAYAQLEGVLSDGVVHEEGIFISLPVYIISLIATAGFTWTIAKHDSQRIRRLDGLEVELKRATQRSRALEIRIEELLDQGARREARQEE